MKNKKLLNYIIILFVGINIAYSSSLQKKEGLDSGIRYGKLKNGLTYYIKPVKDGSAEMEIRLLIKAGKAHEDPDQYELEHVLEHVVFKAGKNMTLEEATDYGLRLGQINGNISYDYTQYLFESIKTKKERDVVFLMLQDIIWNIDFKDRYIDSERSVIINETASRGGFWPASVLRDLESSMIGRGAERPINFEKHINNFTYQALKRYYEDWYHPNLMALVVVGNIDNIDVLENEIKKKFCANKVSGVQRSPVRNYENYLTSPPQFISKETPYTTKESKDEAINMFLYFRKKENRDLSGLEILKNEQKRQLIIGMMRSRLDNQFHKRYGAKFHIASKFSWNKPSLGLRFHVRLEDGSEREVLLETIRFLKQLKMYGFSKQEFNLSKSEYLNSIEKQDTTKIPYWIDNIRDHFIYGKILPTDKLALLKKAMMDLKIEDLNQYFATYTQTEFDKIDIIILAPKGHKALSYSSREIRKWIKDSDKSPIDPYVHPTVPSELIELDFLQNLKKTTYQKIPTDIPGAIEYRLRNGIRIVLKPNDTIGLAKKGGTHKIRFRGFTSKAVSCYPNSDYFSALNAAEIVYNSGVGGLDKFKLKSYLTNKGFEGQIIPYINYNEAGVRGSSAISELDEALHLVYLYFTAPNMNISAFEDWRSSSTSSLAKKNMFMDVFHTTIKDMIGDYTLYPNTNNTIRDTVNTYFDRSFEIYREIYGNPKNFTFIFTGHFSKDKVLAVCQKYLGNIPLSNDKKCASSKILKNDQVPQSRSITIPYSDYLKQVIVNIMWLSKFNNQDFNWKKKIKLELLQSLINFSLSQEMRIKSNDGKLYSIGLWSNMEESRLYNEVFIEFSCKKKDANSLINKSKKIVEAFKSDLVEQSLFDFYVSEKKKYIHKNSKNRILDKIYRCYRFHNEWISPTQEQKYLDSLTPKDINEMANEIFKESPFEFQIVSTKEVY